MISSLGPSGDSLKYEATTNAALGLLIAFPRTRVSALECGILLERRGGSWFQHWARGVLYNPIGFRRTLELAYMSLPVRVRVGLPSGVVRPSLLAGFELGRLLWATLRTRYISNGADYGPGVDVRDDLRRWELATALGGRLSIGGSGMSPFAEFQYVRALTGISLGQPVAGGSIPPVTNREYRLSFGLTL